MPLEAPKLDKRTYQELKNLLQSRIPGYTPEWTDFNESDPGITMIDMFAWLSEMMLFQMNQIPERNYIKFLKMLNLELRPPVPAVAHLTFTPQPNAELQSVPIRTRVAAQNPETGDLVTFETDKGVDVIRYEQSATQVYDGAGFSIVTEANQLSGTNYSPFGWNPQFGSALYIGFTPLEPVDPASGAQVGKFPQNIQFRVFLPPSTQAGEAQNSNDVANPPVSPVSLIWEYRHPLTPDRWQPLTVFNDETAGFSREGYISLQGPSEILASIEGKVQDGTKYWIRCRIDSGVYPAGTIPEIEYIIPNTVSAKSLITLSNEIMGISEGHPDQTFALSKKPVQPDSLVITVGAANPGDEPEIWTMVNDLFQSGPQDKHYTLNATAGTILFGNGQFGQIPLAGSEIVAKVYRYGGGDSANVPEGAINIPLTNITGLAEVNNLRPSVGGKDEQKVDDLKRQAPGMLRSRNRAVTPDDFATLTLQLGGVAKATAIPLAHPDHPGIDVPGTVTVVIVPDNKSYPPKPSSELIRFVCNQLDKYRLLTSELFVKGPEYIEITVQTVVSAKPFFAFGTVEQKIRDALNERLDPLDWTFGRDFFPTGLYRDILRVKDDLGVEMVSEVTHLEMLVNGIPHDDLREAVPVNPDQLVYAGQHKITIVPEQDI